MRKAQIPEIEKLIDTDQETLDKLIRYVELNLHPDQKGQSKVSNLFKRLMDTVMWEKLASSMQRDDRLGLTGDKISAAANQAIGIEADALRTQEETLRAQNESRRSTERRQRCEMVSKLCHPDSGDSDSNKNGSDL